MPGTVTNIASLVLIIGVFYFMIIRPQKKRQQTQKQMLEGLRTGDKIITIGGINGVVTAITGETVIISTGDGESATLEMSKIAISQVVENKNLEDNNSSEDDEEYDEYEDDDEYEEDDDEYEDDEDDDEDDKNQK